MQITPVLFVESVEQSLGFWVDRLGFTKVAEVPHGDTVGFAILKGGDAELMLQSWASAEADVSGHGSFARSSRASLFVEVDDFEETVRKLGDWPVDMPVRDTFYGMREIGVFTPGQHFAVFAAPIPAPAATPAE